MLQHYILSAKLRGQKVMGELVPASYLVSVLLYILPLFCSSYCYGLLIILSLFLSLALYFYSLSSLPQDLSVILEEEAKRLQKAKSNFRVIRWRQLSALMERASLDKKMDRVEVEQAIQFLHECGILLHYDDIKSNLSDIYFLDPQWLCLVMAKVITIKQLTIVHKGGVSYELIN